MKKKLEEKKRDQKKRSVSGKNKIAQQPKIPPASKYADDSGVRDKSVELGILNDDLQNVFSAVHIAIVILDTSLCIRRFSPLAGKLWNITPDDAGRPITRIKANIEIPGLKKILHAAVSGTEVQRKEIRDNNGRWYELEVRAYKKSGNKISGAIIILYDIDISKKLELKLVHYAEVLEKEIVLRTRELANEVAERRAMLESIEEGIFVVDSNKKIKMVNRYGSTMVERSRHEIIGQRLTDIVQLRGERGKAYNIWGSDTTRAGHGERGDISEAVYYLEQKNSEALPVSLISSPINTNGKVAGMIFVLRNISKSVEIDKAKTEFVSLASHELRTPISIIAMNVELLLHYGKHFDENTSRESLKEIDSATRRMTRLITALLNVSRIDLGTIRVIKRPTDMEKLIEDELEQMLLLIQGNDLKVKIKIGKDHTLLNTDPQLVRIIFRNLLSNSIKYTPKGGRITISANTSGKLFVLNVSDTGVGIPQDEQSKIFMKLVRGEQAKASNTGGTGLGLYIVKSFVTKLGGSISVRSTLGAGSTFTVTLPITPLSKSNK